MDLAAIVRFRAEVLGRRKLQACKQRVIVVRDLPQLFAFEGVNLRRGRIGRPQQRKMVCLLVMRVSLTLARRQALHVAGAGERHAGEILHAVVRNRGQHGFAVVGELGCTDGVIKLLREVLRLSAGGIDHHQLRLVIDAVLWRNSLAVDQALAIRRPRQRSLIAAGKASDLPGGRGRCGGDDEDVSVRNAIRVGLRLIAGEGDLPAVRAPLRILLAKRSRASCGRIGQLRELLRRDVEEEEVRLQIGKVALAIFLEVKAINDDGPRLLGLALLGLRLVFRLDRQQQSLRVGRPAEAAEVVFDVGDLLRFAAAAVEHPHLRAFGCATLAPRGEGEVASIGAPLRSAD